MTQKNKKRNIREELSRANDSRRATDLLYGEGLLNEAVSRLYYFLLYSVRALLLTKELEPKSHEGALRLLGLHFVKTGVFEPHISHIFSKLMKFREEADYNPSYLFTKEDYIGLKKEADELFREIKTYLKTKKYL